MRMLRIPRFFSGNGFLATHGKITKNGVISFVTRYMNLLITHSVISRKRFAALIGSVIRLEGFSVRLKSVVMFMYAV